MATAYYEPLPWTPAQLAAGRYGIYPAHLVSAREARGLRVDELARKLEISVTDLKAWEGGQDVDDEAVLFRLCGVLDLPFGFFTRPVPPSLGGVWFCGLEVSDCCRFCHRVADFLCDYPVSPGKTCDAPMCEHCRLPQAEEVDFCRTHVLILERWGRG